MIKLFLVLCLGVFGAAGEFPHSGGVTVGRDYFTGHRMYPITKVRLISQIDQRFIFNVTKNEENFGTFWRLEVNGRRFSSTSSLYEMAGFNLIRKVLWPFTIVRGYNCYLFDNTVPTASIIDFGFESEHMRSVGGVRYIRFFNRPEHSPFVSDIRVMSVLSSFGSRLALSESLPDQINADAAQAYTDNGHPAHYCRPKRHGLLAIQIVFVTFVGAGGIFYFIRAIRSGLSRQIETFDRDIILGVFGIVGSVAGCIIMVISMLE